MTNTSIKLVGGISSQDARRFADEMRSEQEFLLGMQKHQTHTEFACYIKGIESLRHAFPLRVPFGQMEQQAKMSRAAYHALIEQNRARYCAANENPPDKPKDDDSPLGDPELL